MIPDHIGQTLNEITGKFLRQLSLAPHKKRINISSTIIGLKEKERKNLKLELYPCLRSGEN